MRATQQQIDKLNDRTGVPKRSKLRNKWTLCKDDLHKHQSKKEAEKCAELRLLEKAGEIAGLQFQPRFKLVVNGEHICDYVGDFKFYDDRTGKTVLLDVKGMHHGAP